MEAFKLRGPVEKFPAAIHQAAPSTKFTNILSAGRKMAEISGLGTVRALSTATFSREVQWAAVICYVSRQVIADFLCLRAQYYEQFSKGLFPDASNTLDEIDKQCGRSLWTLENKICLISVSDGFEAQKKFVNSEIKDLSRTNIAFMLSSIGERNEPRVSAKAFEQRLKHRSKSWEISPAHQAHIFYRLCNTVEPTEDAFSAVLTYESSYSALDLYETLLDILRRARRQSFFEERSSCAAIVYLDEIDDPRKSALLEYLKDAKGMPRCERSRESEYQAVFRKGDYEKAQSLAAAQIQLQEWDLDAIVAYSKAAVTQGINHEGLGWMASQAIPALRDFFSGAKNAADAVDSLKKIANNLRHTDFSAPLIVLLKSRAYRWFDRVIEQRALYGILLNNCLSLEDGWHGKNVNGNSIVGSTPEFAMASRMYSLIVDGELDLALKEAVSLSESNDSYFQTLGKSYRTNLLSKSLQIEDATEKSVYALIDHPGLIEFTPLLEIIRRRGFRELKNMAGNPALASAFHMYIEHTESSDKEVALKVAWKFYLKSQEVDRPSLLMPIGLTFNRLEAYFLREVCKQDTMELGGAFSSQLDLDRERMAICVQLSKYDPENIDQYSQEIIDLTRRINIEEAVEYLESSRVFVDEIGVQKWAKKNLESQFLRYLDYLTAGLFTSIQELEAELKRIIGSSKRGALTSYLDDYDVSADTLLEGIIRELSQAFLQLPRFGLDAFLSSRIRHGSFVGYVRGPLESKKIITKQRNDTKKYHDNFAMLDRWEINGEKERRIVNTKLALMSEAIDQILDETVAHHLHVKSKTHSEGMVVFGAEVGMATNAVKVWLVALKTSLSEHTTLDGLVSYCFENFFWPSVKFSLDQVQDFVQGALADKLTKALDLFLVAIEGVTTKEQRERIHSDLDVAKAELRLALKRVSYWFDLPQTNSQILSMPLERGLEIGLISTKNVRTGFSPKLNWKICEDANVLIRGAAIAVINDLAFLIFSNISKHAGYEDGDTSEVPEVCVSVTLEEGAIVVLVTNSVHRKKINSEIFDGIEEANERIRSREFDSIEKKRDGTGLVRLAIFVDNYESVMTRNVKFGFNADLRIFSVELPIPVSIISPSEC
ncbi:hypothetical protein GTP81_17215 [Rugamonas sp. FT107W]|uniref:Uncharacterized protein n=1 Tax=Duganella vulcania TaxID=2692166 RepID=A0A845HM30_9BURK|nr:hypothetical protein [Duganella vulcania]MYN18493.1 hypothetical protein [Duganella vulcania]